MQLLSGRRVVSIEPGNLGEPVMPRINSPRRYDQKNLRKYPQQPPSIQTIPSSRPSIGRGLGQC